MVRKRADESEMQGEAGKMRRSFYSICYSVLSRTLSK